MEDTGVKVTASSEPLPVSQDGEEVVRSEVGDIVKILFWRVDKTVLNRFLMMVGVSLFVIALGIAVSFVMRGSITVNTTPAIEKSVDTDKTVPKEQADGR